jgi:capsid protein
MDKNDQTRPVAYWICQLDQYGNPDTAQAVRVPAAQISHLKWPLVDVNAIRGLPPLYFYSAHLEGAAKCLRNMRELVAIQTAIALIREHAEGISGSEIEAWAEQDADKTVVDPDTDETVFQKKLQPGTMLETKAGEKIHFPAAQMNAASFIEVVGADLRAVAAALALPEFIFTADAGRSNYASLMAAEGPAVKTFESLQSWLGDYLLEIYDRVITFGVKRGNLDLQERWGIGRLDSAVLKLESSVTGPSVKTHDAFADARTNMIDAQAGVLSPQEWCASKGRDYEEVMSAIEEHKNKFHDIPWPPTVPNQQGQSTEEYPGMAATGTNGPDKTKTGSEKRNAGGSGA